MNSFRDLRNDVTLPASRFSHVVVASGHNSVPNTPSFAGIESFPGRLLHSHDLRHVEEFRGKKVLIIGASLSAEDIAIQCCKFGAERIVITWRTKPIGKDDAICLSICMSVCL